MPPFNLTPPQKTTVVEEIVQQLLEHMQSGALKPGDKLPTERQLMAVLNVSRASVREALQSLAGMGVIESRAGEGTFIKAMRPHWALEMELRQIARSVDRQDRLHLLSARTVVEKGNIELAIADASTTQLVELQGVTQAWIDACRPEDVKLDLHDQIHLSIAEMTGNPLLVLVLQTLLKALPQDVRNYGIQHGEAAGDETALQNELRIHTELTEAIVQRDLSAAQAVFDAHQAQEATLIQHYYDAK